MSDVPRDPGTTVGALDRTFGPTAEWTARRVELWDQLGVLFLREGFRNLTIGDLAARLSCSRRTLYSLAENREDLIRGVIEHLFDVRLRVADDAARSAAPGPDAVVALLAEGLVALDARAAFLDELRARPSTAAMWTAFRERQRSTLSAAITAGVAVGALDATDPDLVAEVLDAAAERLVLRRAGDGSPSVADSRTLLDTLVRRWLAPD